MHKKILYLVILSTAGCATQNKSVGTGAAIGAVGGAAIGGIVDPGRDGEYRTRNVVVGATLGAILGAASGSALHKRFEDAKKESFEKGKASPKSESGNPPKLSEPKIEARWIEARVQGNRYIEAHWEYIILEPARWEGGQQ